MKKPGQLIFCILLVFSNSFCGYSQLRLPRLVSDSMVLQRGVKNKIWGWATPGDTIRLTISSKRYRAITTANGKWIAQIDPFAAGGPYELNIEGSTKISLKGIVFGDVWFCSGQSNMETPMERLRERYPEELESANNLFIRQFTVPSRPEFNSPADDYPSGKWESVSTATIPRFIAVGYFFAKELYAQYKVPIGLIKSAVGGSPAEAWMSEDALEGFPHYLSMARKLKQPLFVDSIRKTDELISRQWYENAWINDKGMHESTPWYAANYNDADWKTMAIPGYWKEASNGVAWFRKEIVIPNSFANKPALIRFGNVIDRDSIYINEQFIGTVGYQYPPRRYPIASTVLKPGKNIIAIKVINWSGRGGFYPDKPYYITAEKDTLPLTGDWKYKFAAMLPPIPPTLTFNYQPGGLFNAMVAPALNYSIKGVIWYQGEANTNRATEYAKLFPAMIRNWRASWSQGDFPFLFVQLANYMAAKDQPSESNWAALREAQRISVTVPNSAMVIASDLGEWNDIHPLNKLDVGKRLALAARKHAYLEKNIVYSGPIFKSMTISGNKAVIRFDHTGSGLIAKESDSLRYFSIAGPDKKFVWANAIIRGNTVIVWNDNILKPAAVRYAWADNPAGANLYNKEGLPASAFQTDPLK